MTEPAQPPEPARCQMCTEPSSPAGPVLPIGPAGEHVDMGHQECFRAASQDARAGARVRA